MPPRNDIGDRGEHIFRVRITDPVGPNRMPLFRPVHLGEKFETLDFFVELIDPPAGRAYFFVQVKSTSQGYTKATPARLKVQVNQADIDTLRVYPAPTYVVGIDEKAERAYIVSVNDTAMGRISSLPTTYSLNAANLLLLWQEVEGFWRTKNMTFTSAFAI